MPKKPNILWICTDQQRYDTLACYANEFVRTPNLDRLAEDGVLFTHVYAQCTVCAPSRASFLTGRYPRTTRCRQNGQALPADEVLVTKLLHNAGYIGGLSGKLHIAPCHPDACKATERRIDDGYDEFHWSHHPGPDWPTNEYFDWLRERGVEYKTPPIDGMKHVYHGMPEEHHHTTWCARMAVEFIEKRQEDGAPWFFSVNFFDPHHQFDPPDEYLARYADRLDEIPLPNYVRGELDTKPIWQRIDHGGAYGGTRQYVFDEMSDANHRMIRSAYWAMCDLIDAQVGRILEALERTGQRERTIVIFMSDHGEMLGDHGIYLKGPYFYEPAVRVPLIIVWPGMVEPGQRCEALVELVDLAPALLDAVGLPHPPGMQGRSLWPILSGQAGLDRHRDDVYSEFYGANCNYKPRAHATMVRTDRYKVVAAHEQKTGELYDLEEDPNETHNRWSDPEYSGIRLEMMTRLCDRMAWTADPLPIREAPW